MLPTGLKQLVLEKQQADELAAALARERAKEDAEFAAAEAAAAALEWEKVYVVRTEREEAVKRAEEAEEKLRKVAHDAAMRSANWHFPFSQSKADEQVWCSTGWRKRPRTKSSAKGSPLLHWRSRRSKLPRNRSGTKTCAHLQVLVPPVIPFAARVIKRVVWQLPEICLKVLTMTRSWLRGERAISPRLYRGFTLRL